MTENFEFREGDIVKCAVLNGIFKIEEYPTSRAYPIAIYHAPTARTYTLTINGKLHEDHDFPAITLVSRPKKKIKKKVSVWVNVYKDGVMARDVFFHKPDAQSVAISKYNCTYLDTIELTGEYEVEE